MGLAFFSCLGLTFVANFQETKIEAVHLTGAMMVFGLGVLYAFLDTSVSYLMCPVYNGVLICRVRLTLAVCGLISLLVAFIAGALAREQWNAAGYGPGHDRQHWKPEESGYAAHLVSSFGEWCMALSFLSYFFTFIRDFQKFQVEVTANIAVTHLDQDPFFEPDNERTRLLTV